MKLISKTKNNKSTPCLLSSLQVTPSPVITSHKKQKTTTKLSRFKKTITDQLHKTDTQQKLVQTSKSIKQLKSNIIQNDVHNETFKSIDELLKKSKENHLFNNSEKDWKVNKSQMVKSVNLSQNWSQKSSFQTVQEISYFDYGKLKKNYIEPKNNDYQNQSQKNDNYTHNSQDKENSHINFQNAKYQSNNIKQNQKKLNFVLSNNQQTTKAQPLQQKSQNIPFKSIIASEKSSRTIRPINSLKPRKLSMKDFKLGKKLGRGRFGNVYLAEQIQTNMVFAMKILNIKQIKEEKMQDQIINEIKLMAFMNYPNIVKMYTFFSDEKNIYMVLEYADQKCLYKKLTSKLEQGEAAYYIRQVIDAMKYIHSESILHRDIKPENIMVCSGVIKLGDFGWSAYAPQYKRQTFCGTLDYVPPQIIKGQFYDQKVDIWSLGVLIYELTTGHAPFQSPDADQKDAQSQTLHKIINEKLVIPSTLSTNLRALIEKILIKKPEVRLNLEQIEKNQWLEKYRDQGVQIRRDIWYFWNQRIK